MILMNNRPRQPYPPKPNAKVVAKRYKRAYLYSIDYGTNTKTATFMLKEGNKNVFRDLDGTFYFTDEFIATGQVKITILPGQ